MPRTLALLLVDDDPISLAVLEALIRDVAAERGPQGPDLELFSVTGGDAAMAAMAAQRFDGVLLDLMMPVVDGFQVIGRLRERGDATPIVVLTAASKDLRGRVPLDQVALILSKPVSAVDVHKAIDVLAGIRHHAIAVKGR